MEALITPFFSDGRRKYKLAGKWVRIDVLESTAKQLLGDEDVSGVMKRGLARIVEKIRESPRELEYSEIMHVNSVWGILSEYRQDLQNGVIYALKPSEAGLHDSVAKWANYFSRGAFQLRVEIEGENVFKIRKMHKAFNVGVLVGIVNARAAREDHLNCILDKYRHKTALDRFDAYIAAADPNLYDAQRLIKLVPKNCPQ